MSDSRARRPLKLAVLISGSGTTLLNLIQKIQQQRLSADIRLVISSNPTAGGLEHARANDIETVVVEPRKFPTDETFRDAVFQPCRDVDVDLVAMGGFLKHVLIPHDFENRVVNIHPALIPAFCGKGYYGLKVHQAVLDYGAKVSGCTVHFVDNQYDHGPIILQHTVPVVADDSAVSLAARVFEAECEAYPEALRLYADQRLQVTGRRVTVLP